MAQVHRIGLPENSSENRAIRTLAEELPDEYLIFHNFELTTGKGLPFEYDMVVVGSFEVWHVEVKGYQGRIRGDKHLWIFENGYVLPSPIPLANKKTRVLASRLRTLYPEITVSTVILLTDKRARIQLRDEQKDRVVRLEDAAEFFRARGPRTKGGESLRPLHDAIRRTIVGDASPSKPITRIGLYDVIERINQTETRSVFLAEHEYIRTQPKTILKVFHFDVYANPDERDRQIKAIFHDQNAMRVLGTHPNLIRTGDMFAWDDNKFVLPTEYIENALPLAVRLEEQRAEGDEATLITEEEMLDWIGKMARGLRHAHRHGIVHRDVRPLNVVVGPNGVCKLVNFDLALIADSPRLGETRPERLRTRLDPRYVAPEVWDDPAKADARSDIFSLGIVFYELLTGEAPYESIEEWHDPDSTDDPDAAPPLLDRERLRERFHGDVHDVWTVLNRMARRRPSARYASMDEVIEDLAIIGDEPETPSC